MKQDRFTPMQKLAKREEEIMQAFWKLGKAFVKEIIPELPNPQPHYNTVATMARSLMDKGFLGHKKYGNTYQFFPLISKEEYQKYAVKDLLNKYFDNSYKSMVAFFAQEENINTDELEEIIKMIKDQDQNQDQRS